MKYNPFTIHIEKRAPLIGVHSASGIAKVHDRIFIIGDNADGLYELDEKFNKIQFYSFSNSIENQGEIIEKSKKKDFEALEYFQKDGKDYLLVLGSGSKSPERDVCYLIEILEKTVQYEKFSLTNFYQKLRSSNELEGNPLNLEGLAICESSAFIFNRGKNLVWKIQLTDFLEALHSNLDFEYEYWTIHLPSISNFHSGFTGATFLPNSKKILFTSAVENTNNPIDDGDILGSFIGMIDLDNLENNFQPFCQILAFENKTLPIKVESIFCINTSDSKKQIRCICVTDQDGLDSEGIFLTLQFSESV